MTCGQPGQLIEVSGQPVGQPLLAVAAGAAAAAEPVAVTVYAFEQARGETDDDGDQQRRQDQQREAPEGHARAEHGRAPVCAAQPVQPEGQQHQRCRRQDDTPHHAGGPAAQPQPKHQRHAQ
jgi:hypothetical protein